MNTKQTFTVEGVTVPFDEVAAYVLAPPSVRAFVARIIAGGLQATKDARRSIMRDERTIRAELEHAKIDGYESPALSDLADRLHALAEEG